MKLLRRSDVFVKYSNSYQLQFLTIFAGRSQKLAYEIYGMQLSVTQAAMFVYFLIIEGPRRVRYIRTKGVLDMPPFIPMPRLPSLTFLIDWLSDFCFDIAFFNDVACTIPAYCDGNSSIPRPVEFASVYRDFLLTTAPCLAARSYLTILFANFDTMTVPCSVYEPPEFEDAMPVSLLQFVSNYKSFRCFDCDECNLQAPALHL